MDVDKVLAHLGTQIEQHGHAVISTAIDAEAGEGLIALSYTVGLSDRNLPELVVLGLPAEVALPLLNAAAKRLIDGKLETGVPITEIASLPIVMKSVAPAQADGILNLAKVWARRLTPTLQMVWPDRAGHFPWQAEFDASMRSAQPTPYDRPMPSEPHLPTAPPGLLKRKLH